MLRDHWTITLTDIPRDNRVRILAGYIGVLLSAGALYVCTCADGALWQDSGVHQYRIWHNDIEGALGLALAHPLYLFVGIVCKHILIGEFGWRVNLISALFGAITVANLFLLVRLWVGRNFGAVIAAVTLALSWTFWRHCVIAESYTLYTAVLTAELVVLLLYVKTSRTRYLYLLACFNGLAIANHMLGLIPLACYAVFVAILFKNRQVSLKNIAVMVLLWIIGAAPYEYLVVKSMVQTGDIAGTLSSALFGYSYRGDTLNIRLSRPLILQNLMFICYSFPTPNALLFICGLSGLYKVMDTRRFANIMLGLLMLFLAFAFRYTVQDRYAFFIPFYCIVSAFIGLGAHLFSQRWHSRIARVLVLAFLFIPVLVYEFTPMLLERAEIKMPTKRTIPYRNDYTHFLRPRQNSNHSPELFARSALSSVSDAATIIADSTTVSPLWYIQTIEGRRGDVKVVSTLETYNNPTDFPTEENIEQLLSDGAVYVVSPIAGYCPQFLLDDYVFEQAGVLWQVVKRK